MRTLVLPLLALIGMRADAYAFEIQTPITNGCHEELTYESAQAAGFPNFGMAPAPTEEQSRAMDDLVFDLPRSDPWALALFIGVRSNDLGNNAPTDLEALVHVHDDPAEQPAHCIRRPQDDGSQGDVGALDACRAFILGELEAGGLLEDTVDTGGTEVVSSFFLYRGTYDVAVPRFAYRLGRAVHAVQDAYTHTMRDPASGDVRHVLNYVDTFGDNEYVESEDGYPHLSVLDDCGRTEANQQLRNDRAREATTNLMVAIGDDRPRRRDRVTAAVDAALVLMPGCDASNGYCDAPELAEPKDARTFGCAASGDAGWLAIALVALVLTRRRRVVAVVSMLAFAWIPLASAQPLPVPEPPPTEPTPAQPSPPTEPAAPEPPVVTQPHEVSGAEQGTGSALIETEDLSVDWHTNHWHFDARVGGSVDDAGVGGMVGVGRAQERWNFGFLAEWNPWFSFDKVSARPGVFNAYLTVAYRWFQGGRLSIATRIEAGTSTMLFELLGVDKFTTGLYMGGALATIRFPISRSFAVTFDPIHFAMPTPRPFGVPFYYKQYRTTVGIEIPF